MGIFFPAVTGVLAGSSRSGDLKNPSSSIPKGTLAAWAFSSFIYILLVFIYGCGTAR